MAKFGAAHPRPWGELPERQKRERRFARKAGFKNEYAFRAWKREHQKLPESHRMHLAKGLRQDVILAEVPRIKRAHSVNNKRASELIKRWRLMQDERNMLDSWSANQKYHEAIQAFLEDPTLTAGRRKTLMMIERKINLLTRRNADKARKISETTYAKELP